MKIFKKFVRTFDPAPILGEASYEQMSWMLHRYTANPDCQIHIWDSRYRMTSKEHMQQFVRWDDTNRTKYVPEFHDCDDFAVRLWGRSKEWTHGLALGLLIIPGHALNFCIDNKWRMYVIENDDRFFDWVEDDFVGKALEIYI